MRTYCSALITVTACIAILVENQPTFGEQIALQVAYQTPCDGDWAESSQPYHRLVRDENWDSERTAVIVCDVWDSHHCFRAVQRGAQLAPHIERLVKEARSKGMTIIHAPSDCMAYYASSPARKRALDTVQTIDYPNDIDKWCYKIDAESSAIYPIDQSAGGEDDTPEEHTKWLEQLVIDKRNPATPWIKQSDIITIDDQRDYVSDKGKEIWNVLAKHKIQNVILLGVHTNMCVLGRPFGLRRLSEAKLNVVLMRDMTDTMYDPNCSPFVSHFTGTDLIVDHIERHVAGTITSDQIVGGSEFRFAEDHRPTAAILIAEDEYQTREYLPAWSIARLGKYFRLRWIHESSNTRTSIPGIDSINDADLLIVSVRRRPLIDNELQVVREYVAKGRPVLGIRTANHAFALRQGTPEKGSSEWRMWDRDVFGGNYQGHLDNDLMTSISIAPKQSSSIIEGLAGNKWLSRGSLYKVLPLNGRATPLLYGTVLRDNSSSIPDDEDTQPIAWTFTRNDGGKSFYTSLGHPTDWEDDRFGAVLEQAARWLVTK